MGSHYKGSKSEKTALSAFINLTREGFDRIRRVVDAGGGSNEPA